MPLRMRDGPFGVLHRDVNVFERAVRVEGREAQMQFVVSGNGPNVPHFVPEEDAEMRAPGDKIAGAADAAAERGVGEVRRDRHGSLYSSIT